MVWANTKQELHPNFLAVDKTFVVGVFLFFFFNSRRGAVAMPLLFGKQKLTMAGITEKGKEE